MTRRLISLAAISVLALGAVSCAETDQPADPAPAPGATQTQVPPTEEPTTSDSTTTQSPAANDEERNAAALRAIATAEQSQSDGKAYEIDDEGDDDTWEVDVMVGDRSIEVKVSGDGNTVVQTDDDDDADADDRDRLNRAQITLQQAVEAGLAEVPGRFDDAELGDEDDQDVWQISIDEPGLDDTEVYVSPQDGSIIKVDR